MRFICSHNADTRVADVQTTRTATRSEEPTHSRQEHKREQRERGQTAQSVADVAAARRSHTHLGLLQGGGQAPPDSSRPVHAGAHTRKQTHKPWLSELLLEFTVTHTHTPEGLCRT